jgi:hypothetical protein
MSRGKYSPTMYRLNTKGVEYIYNAKGELPAPWDRDNYDEETMFDNYDSEGYDSYGYSAYDADGVYVGIGSGIDRNGYTEFEYLTMSDDEFDSCY